MTNRRNASWRERRQTITSKLEPRITQKTEQNHLTNPAIPPPTLAIVRGFGAGEWGQRHISSERPQGKLGVLLERNSSK